MNICDECARKSCPQRAEFKGTRLLVCTKMIKAKHNCITCSKVKRCFWSNGVMGECHTLRWKPAKPMPSRAAIVRLCKAVRAIDDSIGITSDAKRALEQVEKPLKGK